MLPLVHSLCAALLLLGACTPAKKSQTKTDEQSKPKTLLNLHDVAVLFPLIDWSANDKNEHFKIALDSKLDGSEGFVPEKTMETLGLQGQDFRFRISALRIDPCANHLQAKGNILLCVPQLRLTWQKYVFGEGSVKEMKEGGDPDDKSIHTIYSLNKDKFSSLVGQVRKLHDGAGFDYSKEALGPHVVLLKEGTSGQYYKGLTKIIGEFARASNLTHLAHFRDADTTNSFRWIFMGFTFSKGEFVEQKDLAQEIESHLPPFQSPRHKASLSKDLSRQANFNNSFVVENPNLHNPESVDCAACHTSSRVRYLIETPGANIFFNPRESEDVTSFPIPPEKYLNPNWNMSLDVSKQLDGGKVITQSSFSRSFHVFAIFMDRYRISQRVINESALGADMINTHYASGEAPAAADTPASTSTPTCRDPNSDRDAKGVEDGWGFEDGRSCRVKK